MKRLTKLFSALLIFCSFTVSADISDPRNCPSETENGILVFTCNDSVSIPSGSSFRISQDVGLVIEGDLKLGQSVSILLDSDQASLFVELKDEGELILEQSALLQGDIIQSESVTLKNSARLAGSVNADEDVTLEQKSSVTGSIDSGEEVTLKSGARVDGNVSARDDVTLGQNALVGGDVNAPNSDELNDRQVRGQRCDQNGNFGSCSGEEPQLAQCADVWPEGSVYSGNSLPKPIELPSDENQNPLPQQLQPIDYLRVAPSGGFTDIGENYETNGQTSRVYIEGDLTIQENRQINVDGNPNEFILVVTGDLTIARNVAIKGYIYVGGSLFIQRGANGNNQIEIEGAVSVSGDSFYLNGRGSRTPPAITYVAPEFPLNGGQFCSITEPQPPLPLLNWKLNNGPWDNSIGQVIDSSGNGFNGTSSSVEWSSANPAISTDLSAEGTCGYGEFDYTQNHSIQIDDDANGLNNQLDFGSGEAFTVGLWIKPISFNNSSSLMTVVSKDTNYEFHIRDDGTINWWWNNSSGATQQFDSSTPVTLGAWQYVAIRYKNGEQSISIIDDQYNIDKTQASFTGGLATNNRPLILGNDFNIARYFDGSMDELSVFNESLTDSQLIEVARQTSLCEIAEQVCVEPMLDDDSFSQDWSIINSENSVPRIVNTGSPSPRLRLTDNTNNQGTAITLEQPVAAAGNRIEVTFRMYAYRGNGADGIALVLSDKVPSNAGQFGGSLGYANANGNPGFDGGWLGIGFDAYGNFANGSEGRNGGVGRTPDSVTLRGAEEAVAGRQQYEFIGSSGGLSPGIDDASASTPEPGYLYKVIVDSTDENKISIEVLRDTSGQGNNYNLLYEREDISSLQPAIPNQLYISFAASTGGSTNIHEFDLFQVCTSGGSSTVGIDHYRLEFNSPALTCTGADIAVRSCEDASCNTLSTDSSSVDLSLSSGADSWSENPVTFIGSNTVQLQKYTAGTYQLGVDSASPLAANSDRCFVNGVESTNCQIVFNDTGFLFTDGNNLTNTDLPKQIAGIDYDNLFVHTVELNNNTRQCQSVIAQLNNIELKRDCVNPDTCVSPATYSQAEMSATTDSGTTTLPAAETYTTLPVAFSNGSENISINYGDVGAVRLTARATLPNGKVLESSSDSFVWEPAVIGVSSSNPSENLSNGIIARAGDTITVQLSALNSNGLVTPNFGNENTPERLELSPNVTVNEAGEVAGELTGATSFENPVDGVASSSAIVYSEVGVPQFTAVIESGDYLAGVHAPRATPIQTHEPGRYIPHHFTINTAGFAPTCEFNAGYYYIGQPQLLDGSTKVSAVNAAGIVTKNYDSALPYIQANAGLEFYPFNEDPSSALLPGPSAIKPRSTELTWSDGVGEFPLMNVPSVEYKRVSDNIEGPYNEYQLGVQYNDGESGNYYSTIEAGGTDLTSNSAPRSYYALNNSGIDLLFAQFELKNVFGPPTEALPIMGAVQYWDGSRFRLANQDSCTTFNASAINDDVANDDYDAELQPPSDSEQAVNSGQLFDTSESTANQLAWLESTGTPVNGVESFLFELDVPDFLAADTNNDGNFNESPTAEATFGIHQGNDRQIYWEEVGW